MSPLPRIFLLAALAPLSACGETDLSRSFGLNRDAPDEFQVTTRAPLSMPPDYALRPPRPGAPRPQEQSARDAAEAALVPQTALNGRPSGAPSRGQQALVEASGPSAPADIRRRVEQEQNLDAPSRGLTDRLMFWRDPPAPGVAVDPAREAQRLKENAALGQSPQQGDTAIIQRGRRGLLDGIF